MSNLVTLLIKSSQFVFWQSIKITRSADTVDAIDLSAPFDHKAPGFKESFKPLSFNPIIVSVDDAPLFTGTMLDVTPDVSADAKTVTVNGYSKCGVIQDCTAPADALPLEFNSQNLKQIAEKILGYFKLGVEFKGDPGPAFDRVACDPDKKVFEFLTELSKQRGFLVSSNESGDLLFWKPEKGAATARLEQGISPLIDISPDFNPQEFYTELTGLAPVEVAKAPAKKTVKTKKDKNPPKAKTPKPAKKYSKFSVSDTETEVFRPLVFKIDDVDGADLSTSVESKRARMLGNMVTYSANVSTWRDPSGKLWGIGDTVAIKYPDAMIYDFFELSIKSVVFEKTKDAETANLTLVLPESFSGDIPEVFPWEL